MKRLLAALLYDAAQQGAELMLLTGDIVNLGRREHHEALSEKLRAAEERNLPVLCAGHFNLLTTEGRDPSRSGLYLENADRFAAASKSQY
jgi:3',5'-cyclic AMP phosphodiesterase CpdA